MRTLIGLNTVLYESMKHGTDESARHHPQKCRKSIGTFLLVLINFEEYFLYDLDNGGGRENEFLPAAAEFKLIQ